MADNRYTHGVYDDAYGAYGAQQAFGAHGVQSPGQVPWDDPHGESDPAMEFAPQAPAAEEPGGSLFRLFQVSGAVASLALMVGVGVWGYKLMVRDVSGVPVVRAIEGPMRVQPEDPGGDQADHQGLAVNAVAARGIAEPAPDQVRLAPRPVALTEEDAPMGALKPTPVALTTVEAADEETADKPDPLVEAAVAAFRNRSVDQLVSELTAGVEPLDAPAAAAEADDSATAPAAAETGHDLMVVEDGPVPPDMDAPDLEEDDAAIAVLDDGPGLRRSLRPVARPARGVRMASAGGDDMAAALTAAAAVSAPLDVDPDSIAPGTRLAQLGAFDSPEVARAEWDRLYARFGDYLDGKKRVIQKASSGGRTFYRLRAMGFDDLSDARRFCSALVAENADCIPVTTR